jgi:hypothetical protein
MDGPAPHQGASAEDSRILTATAVIELLAESNISEPARELQQQVDCAHRKLRKEGPDAAEDDIEKTEQSRQALVEKFKEDIRATRKRG